MNNSILYENGTYTTLSTGDMGQVDVTCTDIFGHPTGDWTGDIAGLEGLQGNLTVDPIFCAPNTGDYNLFSHSPCAVENNLDCGQIGALGIGCDGLIFSCYDLQEYDQDTGVYTSPFINISVVVEGVVFSAPQTYSEFGGGYLQDDTGGINFHRWPYETPINEGDRIRITGPLWPDGNGELYLGDFSWTVLETGLLPIPTEYTVTELLSDYHHIGSFVKISGRVVNVTPGSFWLTDETSHVEVFRTDYTEVSFLEVTEDSYWEVLSPCFNVLGAMKLSPRRQNDLNLHHLSSAEDSVVPVTYKLLPCSPNPFNPATTIRYDLPKDSRVHLAIFDLMGHLVKSLRSGEMESVGRQEAVWRGLDQSGRTVAAGVYLYRLKAGDFIDAKQVVLVK